MDGNIEGFKQLWKPTDPNTNVLLMVAEKYYRSEIIKYILPKFVAEIKNSVMISDFSKFSILWKILNVPKGNSLSDKIYGSEISRDELLKMAVGKYEIFSEMVHHSSYPSFPDDYEKMILMLITSKSGDYELGRYLVEEFRTSLTDEIENNDQKREEAMIESIKTDHLYAFKTHFKPNQYYQGETNVTELFSAAAENGSMDIVRYIEDEAYYSPGLRDYSIAMCVAASNGMKIVQHFMEKLKILDDKYKNTSERVNWYDLYECAAKNATDLETLQYFNQKLETVNININLPELYFSILTRNIINGNIKLIQYVLNKLEGYRKTANNDMKQVYQLTYNDIMKYSQQKGRTDIVNLIKRYAANLNIPVQKHHGHINMMFAPRSRFDIRGIQ